MTEPIGERIAILEHRSDAHEEHIYAHDESILSLRDSRHEHGNKLQRVMMQVEAVEKDVRAMEESVIPQINHTIKDLAKEQVDIRAILTASRTDLGWVLRILTFVMTGVVTPLALLWLGYLIAGK